VKRRKAMNKHYRASSLAANLLVVAALVALMAPAAQAKIDVTVNRVIPGSTAFTRNSGDTFDVTFRIRNTNSGNPDKDTSNSGTYTLYAPAFTLKSPAEATGSYTSLAPNASIDLTWTLEAPIVSTDTTYNGGITLTATVNGSDATGSAFFNVTVSAATDTTPPVVTITAPGHDAFYRTATLPELEYSVEDESAYTVEETGWSTSEGTHTVTVTATDVYGNVGSASVTYTVDNTPPNTTIALVGTLVGGWYTGDVLVDLQATDPGAGSGFNRIEYKLGDGAWTTYSESLTISADGVTTLSYRAIDNVGNVEDTQTADIRIDTTPPSLDIALTGIAGDNGWYVSQVMVTLTGGDDVSGLSFVEYSLDGSTWTQYIAPFWISNDGTYTLECVARDLAGNFYLLEENIKIDQTPPVITAWREPEANTLGWNNTSVTASYTASDATSGLASSASGEHTFNTEGAGQFYTFTVYDNAGNPASATVSGVNIDWTPPTTVASLDGPTGNEGWYLVPVEVTLAATDMPTGGSGVLGIYRDENGDETFELGSTAMFTISAQGMTTLAYWAVDGADNEEGEKEVTLWIDSMPPVVTVTLPGTGEYVLGQTIQADWTAADPTPGSGIAEPVSGKVLIPTDELGPHTYSTPQGLASDIAGNLSAPTAVTYSVKYGFVGLLSPYKAPPTTFKINSSIPLKWKYINASSIAQDTPNVNPLVVITKGASFTTGTGDPIVVEYAGKSGYQYDSVTKTHQFNWDTKGLPEGTYDISITCGETGQKDGPFAVQLRK
jgi:hypothetical protein